MPLIPSLTHDIFYPLAYLPINLHKPYHRGHQTAIQGRARPPPLYRKNGL